MTQEKHITPRVLIVEDDLVQARAMELLLSSASAEASDLFGVRPFSIDKAASVRGALQYLDKPPLPYDICLLDLSLPQTDGGGNEEPRAGFEILEHIVKAGTVKNVIVVSVFSEYKYVINAFRSGVFDFIAKPYEPDTLRAQVYNCLQRSLRKESGVIFDQRIRSLVPHAENGLARGFNTAFSPLFTALRQATEAIERFARDQYGLDPGSDPQNGLMVQLCALEESTREARDSMARLQPSLPGAAEKPRTAEVTELLDQINRELLPALTVKRTRLFLQSPSQIARLGKLSVLMFQDDVRAILTEILAGGLSELEDDGGPHNLSVTIERHGKEAIIQFEDDLKPISTENAGLINSGYRILSDPQFKRVWGLSVVQHVAMNGGGYLRIEPNERGNVITYHVPLKNHAEDTSR